jgi:hypothetical protein
MTTLLQLDSGIERVNLTFAHPEAITVASFEIRYTYDIIGCPGVDGVGNERVQRTSLTPFQSNTFSYLLRGLQENAMHRLRIAAINDFGESEGNTLMVDTLITGNNMVSSSFFPPTFIHHHSFPPSFLSPLPSLPKSSPTPHLLPPLASPTLIFPLPVNPYISTVTPSLLYPINSSFFLPTLSPLLPYSSFILPPGMLYSPLFPFSPPFSPWPSFLPLTHSSKWPS